jgi:lysophospholipase L1-like esterase
MNPPMKFQPLLIVIAALLAASPLIAQKPAPPASKKPAAPAVMLPPQPPDVAAPKLGKDGKPNEGFLKSHESFVAIAKKGDTDLLFLGDSITAGWARQQAIWDKAFGSHKPANFGIGGDRTQHLLWRIQNGELDGITPKVAVLMIGTNNSASDPADGIARGVTKIVETIRTKSPKTKVLLLAIFPRGEMPNPQREKLDQVNSTISKLDDGKNVFFLDIGAKFLQPDGTLTKEIMPDFLHLSAKGYQIWADAITPKLTQLLK